ncbi:ATP-dependent Lon protease, bacterial type [Congregibacter litoralis KT71]|uniref:ATP-dependent Lon protease, bacterial type n=1 Tax=Congregibacter litoralis KT71 TaxID=314285 RepID=A4A8I1_9GAMM|nr:ATP-dependent Lon protease, bacterial type [Congregibacter litoralis KT71]
MGEHPVLELPLLPLRDVVVYPHMVLPLFVGRERSIEALEHAMANDKQVLLVAQRNASDDDPRADDIYQVGTVSNILQLLKLPDGTIKVLVEGGFRAAVDFVNDDGEFTVAGVREIEADEPDEEEAEGLLRTTSANFEKYVTLSKKVPAEVLTSLTGIDEPGRLADTIAAHMGVELDQKQKILEISSVKGRLEYLMGLMEAEIDVFQVEKRIRGRVKKQMEKSQREYYLNEQMKAIQKELGEMDEAPNEVDELEQRIAEAKMPDEAKEKTLTELGKLKMMSPMSAEASVLRSYIDWMVSVPWAKRSKVKHDLKRATDILDADHYGLEEVKERILEYLAVQKRVRKVKGPVLCLVGPPGVGKTSLGESIARATNRKFVRMALGGVRDEAEIRGHRRTYIGSMPGKLLQKMAKAGVRNPLFLLDEIDKMGMDHRGDPAQRFGSARSRQNISS